MSDINDLFPGPPQRPDCKEFWQLSEIVLGLDAVADESLRTEGIGSACEKSLDGRLPVEVVDYMAITRSAPTASFFHPLALAVMGPRNILAFLAATWADGFVAGLEYQRKYGGGEQS